MDLPVQTPRNEPQDGERSRPRRAANVANEVIDWINQSQGHFQNTYFASATIPSTSSARTRIETSAIPQCIPPIMSHIIE